MATIPTKRSVKFKFKNFCEIPVEIVTADLLIIGGGNAGCFVAVEAKKISLILRLSSWRKLTLIVLEHAQPEWTPSIPISLRVKHLKIWFDGLVLRLVEDHYER